MAADDVRDNPWRPLPDVDVAALELGVSDGGVNEAGRSGFFGSSENQRLVVVASCGW